MIGTWAKPIESQFSGAKANFLEPMAPGSKPSAAARPYANSALASAIEPRFRSKVKFCETNAIWPAQTKRRNGVDRPRTGLATGRAKFNFRAEAGLDRRSERRICV